MSVIGDIDLEPMLALGVTPWDAGTQGGNIESGIAPHLAGMTEGARAARMAIGAHSLTAGVGTARAASSRQLSKESSSASAAGRAR